MRQNTILFLIILTTLFIACQKVISVKIAKTEPALIINAQLHPELTNNIVYLSQTGISEEDTDLIVRDAKVSLINKNTQKTINFTAQNNGSYLLDSPLTDTSATYHIKIEFQNKTYTSSSNIFKKVENFKYSFKDIGVFNGVIAKSLTIEITDEEPDVFNYYRIKMISDVDSSDVSYFYLNDGQKVDENMVRNEIFTRIPAKLDNNSPISFEIESITAAAYQFFIDVEEVDPSKNFPLNEKPGNPRSTFDNGALGVFSISFISRKNYN